MADEEIFQWQHVFEQASLDLVAIEIRPSALFIPAHNIGVGIFTEEFALIGVAGSRVGIHVR